jgi:hypothetical protein
MMMRHSLAPLALLTACLALVACGERETRAADETVFREQVRGLDKARALEDQAEERKRELDRKIEGQEK